MKPIRSILLVTPNKFYSNYNLFNYAYWISFQITAFPSYGGILFPLAIGAVVVGVPTTFHIPDSGQVCPVLAVVPIGAFAIFIRF
ncbi:hypothetical protein [Aquimarina celericrescens]|uniref:Uncharacterized protein n=1 Tax=Aquimarina celericrescens TaxID=1964542 RepID=A0ABW5B2G3_9FLAO